MTRPTPETGKDEIERHIAVCSTRPSPGSVEGKAWEKGARRGYRWAHEDLTRTAPAPSAPADVGELVERLNGYAKRFRALAKDTTGFMNDAWADDIERASNALRSADSRLAASVKDREDVVMKAIAGFEACMGDDGESCKTDCRCRKITKAVLSAIESQSGASGR